MVDHAERGHREPEGARHSPGGGGPEMVGDVGKEAGEDNRQANHGQRDESESILGRPFASGAIAEARRDAPETRERDGDLSDAF